LERSLGNAAELHGALGHRIVPLRRFGMELVEELMQREKAGPFDVPMGLLCLEREIDAVRELGVQQGNELLSSLLREIVPCRMKA
jgi:hypothetical protein